MRSIVLGKLGLGKLVAAIFMVGIMLAVAAPAQTFQTVVAFDNSNGMDPMAPVVQGSDGNFYGTTASGGAAGDGTVFQLTPAGVLTTLYSFCALINCADGRAPQAGLIQGANGNLYGTTADGGANTSSCLPSGCGTFFQLTPAGVLATLYSFCSEANCADGSQPTGTLILASNGNVYGTTYAGGAHNFGTVFEVTSGGALTVLYSFCSLANCADGSYPMGGVTEGTDGNFYGTTYSGGTGVSTSCANGSCGTVFQLLSTGTLNTLYNFCSLASCADGSNPMAGVVQGGQDNFFGTTVGGGAGHAGTVYKISSAGVLGTTYSFCTASNCVDGASPEAALVEAANGSFYGTTAAGGTKQEGTFFDINSLGRFTTLYSFCIESSCVDGSAPVASLIEVSNGTFYGTTSSGGNCSAMKQGCGTVFSWSPNVLLAPMFTPASLNFGNQTVGTTSKVMSVTIKNVNTGTATLDLLRFTISGPFAISNNTCKATLAAGQTCKVSLTFTPTVTGRASGKLNVTDNAPHSPQTVGLSGTGD